MEIDNDFKTEVLELLDAAEKALLEFEQMPEGTSSKAHYDEVFRAYHNIKGAAGMMEILDLQHHVHQLENILMQTKDDSSIPKKWIGWFLKGNDVARAIMNGEAFEFDYENGEGSESAHHEDSHAASPSTEAVAAPNEEFIAEVSDAQERISSSLFKLETGEITKELIDSLYRDIHSVKGAFQLFGFEQAGNLTHAMENSMEGLRTSGTTTLTDGHVSTLLLALDLLGELLVPQCSEDMCREVNFMVTLLGPFASSYAAPGAVEDKEEVVAKPVAAAKPVVTPAPVAHVHEKVSTSDADKGADTTIRVQVSLLDRLMTLMGEMVLVRNQVLQYSNKCEDLEFLNLSQKLDVVTSELQEETMKTRMQPIGNILTKFQRVVRDLSGSLNKKINLNLVGVETELDKSLIEAVKDPLTHIVRNSCDHGIEIPADRVANGKPETGTLTINAYHEGGQVIVEISDDGRGLSRERLLKKAIEKGIVTAEKASEMKDRDVHALIFAPGFSTAEKVTNVSGRGVGMDVVKSNIEKIGGLVEISSEEGSGTQITLKIPLTLAIVPAMIIRSNEDRFAIPQVKLVELVSVDRKSIEMLQGQGVYRLRGNILPLINLKNILNVAEGEETEEALNIVVLNSQNHLFGLVVDEILDTADIVVKPLARFLKPISIYSGATVLGDGRLAFILDILGIAQKHLGTLGKSADRSIAEKYDQGNQMELREYVLVGLGAQAKHAIPLSVVNRMEEFKTSSIEYSGSQRIVRYRGGILKIVNLNDVLGFPNKTTATELLQIIVVKIEEQTIGIEVDQIIDVLSTRDYFDDSVSTHEAIAGNLVTANEVIVVVDVERICHLTQNKKNAPSFDMKSGLKILVVEDTDSIRNKVTQDLEDKGFEVFSAVDGVDGLKKIAEHKGKFDAIVSDIEMPRMNGFEFATKVRTISMMTSIPMIAFTTKNSNDDLAKAKQAGFSSYLEKSKVKVLPLLIQECVKNKRRVA